MKNYLLGYARPVMNIWGPWKGYGRNLNYLQDAEIYKQMYKISRASAKKFLKGPYEEICITTPVLDARLHQISVHYLIKELWYKEPCNILVMGADTLFVQPTDIFGVYNKMMMFNYTDPKTHMEIPHYFNDDIRYYPSTMTEETWIMGETLMEKWFSDSESDWGTGQIIHNYQLWSQGINIAEALDPTMAFQVLNFDEMQDSLWNSCSVGKAKILHLHSSRGVEDRITVMKAIADQLGILEC